MILGILTHLIHYRYINCSDMPINTNCGHDNRFKLFLFQLKITTRLVTEALLELQNMLIFIATTAKDNPQNIDNVIQNQHVTMKKLLPCFIFSEHLLFMPVENTQSRLKCSVLYIIAHVICICICLLMAMWLAFLIWPTLCFSFNLFIYFPFVRETSNSVHRCTSVTCICTHVLMALWHIVLIRQSYLCNLCQQQLHPLLLKLFIFIHRCVHVASLCTYVGTALWPLIFNLATVFVLVITCP